ncbi:hypothetical protein O3G_MSEX001222 [Manduca sexta]|uniref:Uncharacterized protein n=1 Tax=Manduca sexta TaxID=7130 RepID=A0A921YJL1_MANSE|nr:hypothetical protein O3G_MSEX001222 [Manduca sexta]
MFIKPDKIDKTKSAMYASPGRRVVIGVYLFFANQAIAFKELSPVIDVLFYFLLFKLDLRVNFALRLLKSFGEKQTFKTIVQTINSMLVTLTLTTNNSPASGIISVIGKMNRFRSKSHYIVVVH